MLQEMSLVDCGFLKELGQRAGTRERSSLTLPPMKSLLPISPKSVKLILNVCGVLAEDRVSMFQLKSKICFGPTLQTTGQPRPLLQGTVSTTHFLICGN